MRFLMFSGSGEGAQILKKIELEGNEVGLYIDDKIYKNVFDGLIPKVEKIDDFLDRKTVIIFDMSGFGKIADILRSKGHYVYGASKFADKLEHDRNFGFAQMKKAGITIPEYKEFTDFRVGMQYVKECKTRLVFKPNGSMPCKLTYVSDNSEQLIEYLKFVEQRFGKDIDSFILQEFIEGVVVSSELFFSNGEPLYPANHTVEVKKSMNDDLGPSTGCSGNIAWNAMDGIIENGIYRITTAIREEKYSGQIDLNTVVNEKGVYGLEWTPRFGYDATPTYLPMIDIDYGQFFSDIATGQSREVISTDPEYAGAVRISIPPYPMEVKSGLDTEKVSPNMGIPIQDWQEYQNNLYFYEVMCKNGALVHSGGTGVIAIAIDFKKTPEKCLDFPYKVAEKIKIPDKQYRTDLKSVLGKMVKEVQKYA